MTATHLYRSTDDRMRFVEHADGTGDLMFLDAAGRVTRVEAMLRADTTSLLRAIADQGVAEMTAQADERAGAS